MSEAWPKIICDPVHGLISFDQDERLLLDLVNTREFQRLRRIKQLGMSEMVFPGSNHSRLAHSVGVMHVAKRFLGRIQQLGVKLEAMDRLLVLAAALLHDLGHGPFSHAFEKITGEDHETRTREIILANQTEVNKCLVQADSSLPVRLAGFFDKSTKLISSTQNSGTRSNQMPDYLTHIISSELDADRCDFLLRDSYATGADYGHFDLDWLIDHLCIDEAKSRFYLHRKSQFAAESYVYARYHMYQAVYFHKTTRAAEVMLRVVFRRYKDLIQSSGAGGERSQIVPGAPPRVLEAFSSKMALDNYLLLDDVTIWEFLKACEGSPDSVLKEVGGGLVHRKLFKVSDLSHIFQDDPAKGVDAVRKAEEAVQKHGLEPRYFFQEDSIKDVPYPPYNPDKDKREQDAQIYIGNSPEDSKELSVESKPVKALTENINTIRYYYPERVRDTMDEVALAKEVSHE